MTQKHDASFQDRFVVLTGAGRAGQTGEVIARAFAERGARMILIDRDPVNASRNAGELTTAGFHAIGLACDLSSEEQVAAQVPVIQAACGESGLAALVNAAGGFAMSGNIADSAFDAWQRMFSINLTTAYLTTRALLPLLRRGGGAIVNFTTGAAAQPGQKVAGMSAYAAAKGAVLTLTRATAQEERGNGVRVNAVAPSAIRTADNLRSMGEGVRYVEREEVAQAVVFLCSPAASAISGEVIRLA